MRRFVLPLIVLVAAPAWGQTPATFKVGTAAASRGQTAFGAIEVPAGSDAAPRVILEAFSAGVPVVAFASGGIPELVDSSAGLLSPQCTPDSLAASSTLGANQVSFPASASRCRSCGKLFTSSANA